MNKRVMAALMAASIMFSFAACNKAATPSETTTEETTTAEETTTTEETTEEETTTTEETTTSEETTTVVEDVSETTTETTKAPTAKAKKSSVPSVPKGYKKVYWNKKFQGHKVYLILKESKGKLIYKGWWKNKWVDLWYDEAGDDYQGWQIKDSKHTIYYETGN